MSERQVATLIAAALLGACIAGALALSDWLNAPYRTCVETHSVDTCHRIFNP